MTENMLEILILRGQIDAVRHVIHNWDTTDDINTKSLIEDFWNDLENLKERLLLEEFTKIAPNYANLVKERLS